MKELLNEESDYKKLLSKSKIIKSYIERDIKFLEILLELEDNICVIEEPKIKISFQQKNPEYIDSIKKLKLEEEKIKRLEELYEKGVNLNEISRIYNEIKK